MTGTLLGVTIEGVPVQLLIAAPARFGVYEVAVEHRLALEVNGLPPRLDLSGEHVRDAPQAGARVVCSTDAHSVAGLGHMALSVDTARRGWATAADVVNTRSLRDLLAWGSAVKRRQVARRREPRFARIDASECDWGARILVQWGRWNGTVVMMIPS